jgi:L-cysteine desulfidase
MNDDQTQTFAEAQDKFDAENSQQDLTKARDERVLPVVKVMIEEMLKQNMLISDMSFLKQLTIAAVEDIFRNHFVVQLDAIYKTIEQTIRVNNGMSLEKLWGKPVDQIGVRDLNDVVAGEDKDLPEGK